MAIISRISPLTGNRNTIEVDMTDTEFSAAQKAWRGGAFIQDAFPKLTPEDRDFIKFGYTPEDWKALFGDEDE